MLGAGHHPEHKAFQRPLGGHPGGLKVIVQKADYISIPMQPRAWSGLKPASLLLVAFALFSACGGSDGSIAWPRAPDGGRTAFGDAGGGLRTGLVGDASSDGAAAGDARDGGPSVDATPDAALMVLVPDAQVVMMPMVGPDAAVDVAPDAVDSAPDVAPDVAPPSPDLSPDVEPDAPVLQPLDAPTGTDAGADVPVGPSRPDMAPEMIRPDMAPDVGPTGITMLRSKDHLNVSVGDRAIISARLTQIVQDAGVGAGVWVTFTTNLGAFFDDAGVSKGAMVTVLTDDNGDARVTLGETGNTGTATVTASRDLAMSAMITMPITPVTLSFDKATCNGNICSIMGIKGSGYNEKALVGFKLLDSAMAPIGGALISFSGINFPTGAKLSPTGLTDPSGRAVAEVESGSYTGAFTVRATIAGSMFNADSTVIGLRGARPSNRGFSLQCAPVNIPAYISPTPPQAISVTCNLKLVDRFGNPIGTGAPVYMRAEAGAIPFSTETKAFSGGAALDEGTGTATFSTVGVWPPQDVQPLPIDAAQWPKPRDAEPLVMDGALKYNPRDGLVSVIAYIKGEEYFQDDNSNGTRDANEMFIDQGEPFVDSNDNGTWDAGEPYVDDAPTDGMWNAPNGVWDATTTIWTEARILYTGRATAVTFNPTTFGTLKIGLPTATDVTKTVYVSASDKNVNLPTANGTSVTCGFMAERGTMSASPAPSYPDSYGFGVERWLVSAADGKECTSATPVCRYATLFFDWRQGALGIAKLVGPLPPTTPYMTSPVSANLKCDVVVQGVTISGNATGLVE